MPRDPADELLAFPNRTLRDLFAAHWHGPHEWRALQERGQAAYPVVFAGDPLPVSLDLLQIAPRWDAWRRGQPTTPGQAGLGGVLTDALDTGRRMAVAYHGARLPIPPARLARALDATARLIALGDHGRRGGVTWIEPLVSEAAARNDAASRGALAMMFATIVGGTIHGRDTAIARADELLPLSGLRRDEVPALLALDRRTAALDAARARAFAELGEPLGEALRAVLDQEQQAIGYSLTDTVKHAAMRALADLSPAERGAALHRLLGFLARNETRFGSVGWNEAQKRGTRYTVEIVPTDMPRGIGNLLGVLASRKIELVNPDADMAAFLGLIGRFVLLGNKKIVDLILATVAAHPRGRAAAALRAAIAPDRNVHALRDHKLAIEDVLRGLPVAGGEPAHPGGFGRKGIEAAALPGLPAVALPVLEVNHWRATDLIGEHFDNLFDARLHDAAHRDLLARLTALFDDLTPLDDTARQNRREVLARARGLPWSTGKDAWRGAGIVYAAAMLGADLKARFDAFAPFVTAHPEAARGLSRLAVELGDRSAPPARWLVEGRAALASIPAASRMALVRSLVGTPSPKSFQRGNESHLRALLFLSADLDPAELGPLLTDYALKRCYVTLPGHGIRNEKLGNACLWVLAALPAGTGVPYLARILARTKYPKIKAKVDAKLNEAAAAAGIDRAMLDELTVPTHDLDRDGRCTVAVGDGTATLRVVDGRSAAVDWATAAGKPLRAPSVAMKADADALKAVRLAVKELDADLSVQPQRLQQVYLADRSWPAEVWRERYLNHPLLRALASRLIWWVERDGEAVAALPEGDSMVDVAGRPVALDGATVRLWHPVDATAAAIEAWRDRLEARQMTQPFAQAWREVYALTEAERTTGTYSNRWAAHLLRQHQAMTLARINGWRVTHRVGFDTPNDQPWHLVIPAHGLVVDYWVEGAGGDEPETTESGAFAYVATDRVQFHAATGGDSARGPMRGPAVPLADLPPVVFSEIMRHCDLFTAVASIAADPNWLDRGGDAAHPNQWGQAAAAYWHRTNTADLEESGKRRRAMLARIVPRLKIADRLALEDRYLAVAGTRHRYRIHLGSGACFRGERHICIVPASEREAGRLWLPFEGDRTLSIILSKAALLAADERITDPVILAQL